jgi:Mrp family chromosome partitioning ATPase
MSEKNSKGKTPEDYGFHMPEKKNSFKIELNEKSSIKKIIGVVSGKGGVGKSFVTSMLASEMARRGYRVAVLDGDITGPSQTKAFGIHDKAMGDGKLIYPYITKNNIQVISTNMILDSDETPVIWRGPMVANILKQFYTDVVWDDVDYMFVDMPPGTSDVPLTAFQSFPLDGIVVVTCPQELVSMVVEKAINMANQMNVNVLGLVENMSYLECPNCKEKIEIFGKSHIQEVADKYAIPVLAKVPMRQEISRSADEGTMEDLEVEEIKAAVNYIEKVNSDTTR